MIGSTVFRLDSWASSTGPAFADEFGRNLFLSTAQSLLGSYFEAAFNAFVAVAIPLLIAGLAAAGSSQFLRWLTYWAARVLDAIPLFLWVALIFSTLGFYGLWGRQLAIVVAALPFTLGLVLKRFDEVSALPFVQNARSCGIRLPQRLWRLVIPNGLSAVYFPFVTVFGLSLTFDAILGILGMTTRTSLSLGTLIWRAKERAAVDNTLSMLAIAAMLLTIGLFALMARQASRLAILRRPVANVAVGRPE
jgi:ABC-type dipeptide/oligopeptide/nickel transport system permease subunit